MTSATRIAAIVCARHLAHADGDDLSDGCCPARHGGEAVTGEVRNAVRQVGSVIYGPDVESRPESVRHSTVHYSAAGQKAVLSMQVSRW